VSRNESGAAPPPIFYAGVNRAQVDNPVHSGRSPSKTGFVKHSEEKMPYLSAIPLGSIRAFRCVVFRYGGAEL
jgi:hypothetical protein